MTDMEILGAAIAYTNKCIAGAGGLKGANCTIKSIDPITGGNRITFEWEDNEGHTETSTMDVMNGADGQDGVSPTISVSTITGGHAVSITDAQGTNTFNVMDGIDGANGSDGKDGKDGTNGTNGTDGVGIASITFKGTDASGNNIYTVNLSNNTSYDITCPKGPAGATGSTGPAGPGVASGGTADQVLVKKSATDYDTDWKTLTKSDVGLGNVPNVSTNNQEPTFTEASARNNIVSGEKISVMLGKISKFFNDLKTVAFTGSYSDLSDKPQVKQAASGGTDESLVTTGEKYIWGQTATGSVQGRVYIDYNYKNTAALNYDDIALSMTGARMLYAEVRAVFVSGVLATGSTSITLEFTDINRVFDYSSQFSDVLVDIYTDVPGLTYESITETITQVTEPGPSGPQTSNKLSVTLTFEAQSSAVNVTMRLSKKGA